MSVPFSIGSKLPGEKLDFTIDWETALDGATISSSTFTVPTGIVRESTSKTSTTTTIKVSGGTLNTEHDITNTVETSDGLMLVRVLRIVVGAIPSAEEVKQIISTTSTNLQPYIIAGYRIVRDNLYDVDPFTKKEIIRWLAAHFLSMESGSEGRVIEKEVGEARERYVGEQAEVFAKALGSTRYGQQAIALDPTGTLYNLGRPRAKFKAVRFRTS